MTVLSIQSRVACGHVGNAAAVFPLQRLGFDVWPVDTVVFSNHPGHASYAGRVLEPEEVGSILDGIAEHAGLADIEAVLSGYLGRPETGIEVLKIVGEVKHARPSAVWACDPVMGDRDEGLYVADALADFFREHAVPRADVLFPNAFELEILTGLPARNPIMALEAARRLLDLGTGLVVVTSLETGILHRVGNLVVGREGAWLVETPRLETPVKGAGDVFAALFLAHWLGHRDARRALEEASAAIFGVIEATKAAGADELQLVKAQDVMAVPQQTFAARVPEVL